MIAFGAANIAAVVTVRFVDAWNSSLPTRTTEQFIPLPFGGRLRNLRIKATAALSLANVAFVVRVNGVNTALTATLLAAATTASNLANTVVVAAGDLVSVSDTRSIATGTNGEDIHLSIELDP